MLGMHLERADNTVRLLRSYLEAFAEPDETGRPSYYVWTALPEGATCVLISFDSTIRSNLSVGLPIDLMLYPRDSFDTRQRRRFDENDAYYREIRQAR